MAFKTIGDDILYELPSKNKIIIYFKKCEDKYVDSCKAFGTHYLEQTLDEHNNVISEVIKENPHKVDFPSSLFSDEYL